MAKAVFRQNGESLDYINTGVTTIAATTVIDINGKRIGVAGCEIPPGEMGSLMVKGVYSIPKKVAATVFAMGDPVEFDGDGIVAAGGSETPAGWVIENSPTLKPDVLVDING